MITKAKHPPGQWPKAVSRERGTAPLADAESATNSPLTVI